ncbi:hypothetical protein GCM10010406_40280 [Streptomyces thermolineatus]|uniref:DUF302 domain-containing protein n=1 Tax=Streptomyces thermolineatus TaxID=44033 RepID=A0ABP5ZM32_9ACTN
MTTSLDVKRTEGVDAGRDWDGVKMTLHTTRRVQRDLVNSGRATGPVLYDAKRQVGYMFVRPGALGGALPGAVLITNGVVVVPRYPCSDVLDRRYWAVYGARRPGPDSYADHEALVSALERIARAGRLLDDVLFAGAAP